MLYGTRINRTMQLLWSGYRRKSTKARCEFSRWKKRRTKERKRRKKSWGRLSRRLHRYLWRRHVLRKRYRLLPLVIITEITMTTMTIHHYRGTLRMYRRKTIAKAGHTWTTQQYGHSCTTLCSHLTQLRNSLSRRWPSSVIGSCSQKLC